MDKRKLLNLVIQEVQARFDALAKSALDAKDAATNEESKAENKYDTRGLEASYLAGAQAERSEKMKESLFYLQKINDQELVKKDIAELLSIVTIQDEEGVSKKLFILPVQGGIKVNFDGNYVQTITLSSPIGKLIYKKPVNEEVLLKQGKSQTYYEIISID